MHLLYRLLYPQVALATRALYLYTLLLEAARPLTQAATTAAVQLPYNSSGNNTAQAQGQGQGQDQGQRQQGLAPDVPQALAPLPPAVIELLSELLRDLQRLWDLGPQALLGPLLQALPEGGEGKGKEGVSGKEKVREGRKERDKEKGSREKGKEKGGRETECCGGGSSLHSLGASPSVQIPTSASGRTCCAAAAALAILHSLGFHALAKSRARQLCAQYLCAAAQRSTAPPAKGQRGKSQREAQRGAARAGGGRERGAGGGDVAGGSSGASGSGGATEQVGTTASQLANPPLPTSTPPPDA